MIFAGDVGGTHTRLALLEVQNGDLRVREAMTFPSPSAASLEVLIDPFLLDHPGKLEAACIGIAGPVKEGRAVVTNLPWTVDAPQLARHLSLPEVGLINDVEANAWAVSALSPGDFTILNSGTAVPESTAAVIAAGTGLGQAGLCWSGGEHLPIPSEGGHVDFAPRNRLEIELLEYLQQKLGKRVSYERVLSGPGLLNIYSFLRDTGRGEEPDWLAKKLTAANAPAEISAAASQCTLADMAMELFVSIYGAAAGNVALQFMATAGVFIGGGIAPRIISRLKEKTFLEAYLDKGRLTPVVSAIPVRVIMNDMAALLGAARCAWRLRRTRST
jgi:glucokinase